MRLPALILAGIIAASPLPPKQRVWIDANQVGTSSAYVAGTEQTLISRTLPIGAISIGDVVTVTAWGTFAGAPFPLELRAYFGDSLILLDEDSPVLDGGNLGQPSKWRITYRVLVTYTNQQAFESLSTRSVLNEVFSGQGDTATPTYNQIVVRFTGTEPVGGDNFIVQRGMTVVVN